MPTLWRLRRRGCKVSIPAYTIKTPFRTGSYQGCEARASLASALGLWIVDLLWSPFDLPYVSHQHCSGHSVRAEAAKKEEPQDEDARHAQSIGKDRLQGEDGAIVG